MSEKQADRTPFKRTSGVSRPSSRLFIAHIGVLVGLWFAPFSVQAASDGKIGVDISRIGDASHFEFAGASQWNYDFKRVPGQSEKVVLRVQGLKQQTLEQLKTYSDTLIKGVSINENGVDGATEVTFTLSPGSDFFDYISDQPSRLVVDFFPKEGSKDALKAEAKASAPAGKGSKKGPKKSASASDDDSFDDQALTSEDGAGGHQQGANTLIVKTLPAKAKRNPAGTDFVVVAKNDPQASSVAEEVSRSKGFSHGIFDGGDPEFRRFSIKDFEVKENAIIASRANIYLPFPMLELGSPHLKSLLEAPPIYEIVPNETLENKEARLLLTLFSNKRRAIFLKTAQEFLKTYPQSPYDEIVRYMMADVHYGLWRTQGAAQDFDAAMGVYRYLTEKYPDSPMTARTLLLTGYAYLDRGDSFGALKTFQRFVRLKPDSKYGDQVKISMAEAYLKLNRFDDAYALLDEVETTGKSTKARQEAAYRKGDVFFRKKDFDGSIQQYKAAIKKYPDAESKYPNAWYNTAEADFIRDRYREGLEAYRLFLQKFPDHEYGGYAMTRMGELLQILGAENKRSEGAYLESNFRYRNTPGAGIGRIRLLAGRMPHMKEKELSDSLREIASITERYSNRPKAEEKANENTSGKDGVKGASNETAANSEGESGAEGGAKKEGEAGGHASVAKQEEEERPKKLPELPGIEEFSTILIADGFKAREDYDRAANDLISYYQKNPQSPNKDKIRTRIVQNLTEGIRAAVDRGDFIEALRRYSKNSGGWLKNADRIDLIYNVGRAYEQAGVLKEASSIYRETLKRLADLKGSANEKERSVFEVLPKPDAVNLRLASVAARDRDFASAENFLKTIKGEGQLTDVEQIERAEVSADVAEARGQSDVARKYLTELINAWKGEPQLTGSLHLRLAKIYTKDKDFKQADAHLEKIVSMRKQGGRLPDDVYAKALEMRGDTLLSRGKRPEAVAAYRDLLEAFEDKRPLSSIRYRIGQILYEDGDLKGAEAAWVELKPDQDNVWQRLASEQMRSAKWQDEYKKYINRIPAAAEIRDGSTAKR